MVPAAHRPFVGHEEDRATRPFAPLAEQIGDAVLVPEVQARERLVAEEQVWLAHERLSDAEALLLPTGEAADRGVRVRRGLHGCDRRRHPRARGGVRQPDPPAVTVEPEPHEVAAPQRRLSVEVLVLRHVPDAGIAPPRRGAPDLDLSARRRDKTENRAE